MNLNPENDLWTAFERAEPEESACLNGWLLIWHVFRGVIAERWEHRHDTPMYTHWAAMPRNEWIHAQARRPTLADADVMHCVLAMHEEDGIRVTGWHQIRENGPYTHWMHTPIPPSDAKEYLKRF